MNWKVQRCTRCRKVLDEDELYYYGGTCEACEGDFMAQLNELSGWRWWLRVLAYGTRYVVGSAGMLVDSWRRT